MEEILTKLNETIGNFEVITKEVEILLENALEVQYYGLAKHAEMANDGLSGMVSYLKEVEYNLKKVSGVRDIPITNLDKPRLAIVKKRKLFNFTTSPLM